MSKENQQFYKYKQLQLNFLKKQYLGIFNSYESDLPFVFQDKDKIQFHINIALIYLKLNLKQEYYQQIVYVLQMDPVNEKAHYHLIKSQILLAFTNPKKQTYQQIQNSIQQNKFLRKKLKYQLKQYLQTQKSFQTGKDINWLKALINKQYGQYINPKVAVLKDKNGVGMYALQDIKIGQMILIQKKSFSIFNLQPQFSTTLKSVIQLLKKSNQFKAKMNRFYYIGDKDDNYTFLKLKLILKLNSFKDFSQENRQILQLYDLLAKLNHSCVQNCSYYIQKGFSICFANSNIKKDEQLTISYYSHCVQNVEQRRQKIFNDFNFWCQCQLCLQQLGQKIITKNRLKITIQQELRSIKTINQLKQFLDKYEHKILNTYFCISLLKVMQKFHPPLAQKIATKIYPIPIHRYRLLEKIYN